MSLCENLCRISTVTTGVRNSFSINKDVCSLVTFIDFPSVSFFVLGHRIMFKWLLFAVDCKYVHFDHS